MESPGNDTDLDSRLAERLRQMRTARGWSLDQLAERSGVSRATLSRLENGEVSATTAVLGRLTAAHGMTLSRLMLSVEDDFPALVPAAAQPLWRDPSIAFERRSVSPPSRRLSGEVLACRLGADTRIAYEQPPRPGLEHHLMLIDGRLTVTVDAARHALAPGDCLRYRLDGASVFETPPDVGAHYLLFMV